MRFIKTRDEETVVSKAMWIGLHAKLITDTAKQILYLHGR